MFNHRWLFNSLYLVFYSYNFTVPYRCWLRKNWNSKQWRSQHWQMMFKKNLSLPAEEKNVNNINPLGYDAPLCDLEAKQIKILLTFGSEIQIAKVSKSDESIFPNSRKGYKVIFMFFDWFFFKRLVKWFSTFFFSAVILNLLNFTKHLQNFFSNQIVLHKTHTFIIHEYSIRHFALNTSLKISLKHWICKSNMIWERRQA